MGCWVFLHHHYPLLPGSLVSPRPPVGPIVPIPPRPCCPAVVWFVVVLSLFVPSRPPSAPSFPSRCSPFPPREQLLAAVEWGAAVVAAAAVVVAVIPNFPVVVVIWSLDLVHLTAIVLLFLVALATLVVPSFLRSSLLSQVLLLVMAVVDGGVVAL